MQGLLDRKVKGKKVRRFIRETAVETYLREQVESWGGLCEKHVSPGHRGVPDRLITWPTPGYGVMHLVETKRPTDSKARAEQLRDHARRRKMGVTVRIIYAVAGVDEYIREMVAFLRLA